ncbi:MAG: hypothetical protein RRZ24_05845 [Clostridia bacterium]
MEPNGRIAEWERAISRDLACRTEEVYDKRVALLNGRCPRCYMQDFGVTQDDILSFIEPVHTRQKRLMKNACTPLDSRALEQIYTSVLHA